MDKTQLENKKLLLEKKLLINIKDLILQTMEVLNEIEKGQKRAAFIHWIIITFGALLGIGILSLIVFL